MNTAQAQDLLIDYIDGKLSPEKEEEMAEALNADVLLLKEYEETLMLMQQMSNSLDPAPSASMKANFQAMLNKEISASEKSSIIRFIKREQSVSGSPLKMAASVSIIMIGIFAAIWIARDSVRDKEIQALKQEMEATRELLIRTLQDRNSASTRIMGVNQVSQIERPDDEIIDALLKTYNQDDNTNVRLAAFRALSKFVDDEKVKNALIQSLETQSDPIVQIELINLMVQMKEKKALEPLKKITEDQKVLEAVRDEAYKGIFILS